MAENHFGALFERKTRKDRKKKFRNDSFSRDEVKGFKKQRQKINRRIAQEQFEEEMDYSY